jgi:hypothetical protein
MNDDLDVRGAFDAVYDSAAALAALQARDGLSRADADRAADILRRIDSVWRITGFS